MTPALEVTWSTPYGRSWTPVGDAPMERHAHALRVGDEIWLIDPIDCTGLEDVVAELGGVVAHVVVLLDRHLRDSEAVAEHFGAQLHVVAGDSRQDIPSSALRFDDALPGSPFEVLQVRDTGSLWHERALWWSEHELLVVAESLGSASGFTLGTDSAVAVHPMLRLTPPRETFAELTPSTILFGHGPAVTTDAPGSITIALEESRTGTPGFIAGAAKHAVKSVFGKS